MLKLNFKVISLIFVVVLLSSLALDGAGGKSALAAEAFTYSNQTLLSPSYMPNLPTGANRAKVGIATHPWWLDMQTETFIQNFKKLQVGIVRLPVEWKVLEPQPGQYDWSVDDRLLNRLNDEGFEVVAEFVTIPPWASSNPAVCAKKDVLCGFNPAYMDHFQAVVAATARRYPFIRHWEFWNEPELWPEAGQDGAVYLRWLTAFYQSIKQVDPTMLVAPCTDAGPDYISYLYNLVEATTGTHNYPWDAIAYHPYNDAQEKDADGTRATIAKSRVEALHQLMVQHGEGQKPIWITEISFEGAPAVQAKAMVSAFEWLLSKDYIDMVVLHMLHDYDEQNVGLMATIPEIFPAKGNITADTKLVPKQPYYDVFMNFPKRRLLPAPASDGDTLVFTETGHTVRGIFKQVWQRENGLQLFGYPKTGQFYERNSADGRYYLVQYFERVRMEYHPEFKGTPYEVEFGLLGTETMLEAGLLDSAGRPLSLVTQSEPDAKASNNQYFKETGFNVNGMFLQTWRKLGGLSVIGLPLSRSFAETQHDGSILTVQYFERARLELHTGPDGQPLVLLTLLGNQRLAEQGRLDLNYQPYQQNYYNPANYEFLLPN